MALEKQYRDTRRELRRLLRQSRYKPDSVKPSAVKTQLDLVKALIRLTKEETAFFVKLGQLYDISRFTDDLVELLKRHDTDLLARLIEQVDRNYVSETTQT